MRITNIQGTNIELTDTIQAYITQKIEDISRFTKRFDPCDVAVEVGKTSDHHNKGDIFFAEMNVVILGDVLRSHAERDDLYAAIDEAKDDVKRQLIEKKEKLVDARESGDGVVIEDEALVDGEEDMELEADLAVAAESEE